jgi:hypothetical protein
MVIGLVVIFVVVGAVVARELNPSAASGITDPTPLARTNAYREITIERKNLINDLIAIVESKEVDTDFHSPLRLAIDLLGEFRAQEAVEPLIQRLMYIPDNFSTDEEIPAEAYFVSAVALRNIGQPAVQPLVNKIVQSNNEEERDLAAWVIMNIEGSEQSVFRLNRCASRDAQRSLRYADAVRFIESYTPDFDHPRRSQIDPVAP